MSSDLGAAHQAPHPRAHRRNVVERRIDRAGIALPYRGGADGGPVRPFRSRIAIPLGISREHRTAFVGRSFARAAYCVRRRLCFLAAAIRFVGFVAPLDPRCVDHQLDNVILRLRAVAEIP